MTSIKIPAWDWGSIADEKLDKLLLKGEQLDYFCEYLLNEIPVDNLVWHMLRYTPQDVLKQIAEDIGAYKIEEN
jgi:hypothetical protein